jgi:hypothetical protein
MRLLLRMVLASSAVLVSAAALAQSGAPPMVGDKPLVQVKPRVAAVAKQAPARQQSTAVRLQACLDIDDGTKERLNCYDAVLAPVAKPRAAAPKTVAECRFTKEEDERLACFNGFVESMPKLPKS